MATFSSPCSIFSLFLSLTPCHTLSLNLFTQNYFLSDGLSLSSYFSLIHYQSFSRSVSLYLWIFLLRITFCQMAFLCPRLSLSLSLKMYLSPPFFTSLSFLCSFPLCHFILRLSQVHTHFSRFRSRTFLPCNNQRNLKAGIKK